MFLVLVSGIPASRSRCEVPDPEILGIAHIGVQYKLVPCYRLNSTTGILHCIIGCDWFIDWPIRLPVTFQIMRGFKLRVKKKCLKILIAKANLCEFWEKWIYPRFCKDYWIEICRFLLFLKISRIIIWVIFSQVWVHNYYTLFRDSRQISQSYYWRPGLAYTWP